MTAVPPAASPVIVIAECPFGGLWFVGIPDGRALEFADLELAREWAARLSEAAGFPIIDRAGE